MASQTLEVMEEYFDIKDPILISNNVEKIDHLQVSPAPGQGTLNGASTIVCEISNTQNYLLVSDSVLKIAGKFTKNDGSTPITATDLELENIWGWSLFKSAWLDIGGTNVERIDDVRNATTLLGHCLKSRLYSQHYGESDGWIPDRGARTAAAANLGWTQRVALFGDGTNLTSSSFEIYLRMRDLFGFCDVRKILYLIPLKLTLLRNDDDKLVFFNNAAPADNSKVILTDIKWLIPSITPSSERKIAIQKLLSTNDFIPWTFLKRSTFNQTFSAGAGGTWVIKTTSANPRYFVIGFKELGAGKTGDNQYAGNNAVFDSAGVTDIQVDLNGNFYPIQPLKANFTTRQVIDCYRAYSNFCLKNGVEPPLSLNEWISINTIYVIDTSALSDNMKNNSILVKIEVKRDSASLQAVGYCVLFEDDSTRGFKVGEGRFLEWR